MKADAEEKSRKEYRTLSKLVQQFYQINASELTTIGRKKELMQLAVEAGLIDQPIKTKLDEVQELRVKLAKYDRTMTCSICEEIVSV